MTRPRALLIAGYFDWFSGYQETVLAPALAEHTDLEILASDRVAPIFTDAHLARLGVPRHYDAGSREERGALFHRVPVNEWRGMVWGDEARKLINRRPFDLIVQVMPGQGLPLAASLARSEAVRVVLYGDNSAMWANLSVAKRRVKWLVFSMTKGLTYRFANRRADVSYGYTPETLTRLQPFSANPMRLLPLAFDQSRFFLSDDLREQGRAERGYGPAERVVLFAGKFDQVKRIDLLIRAFAAGTPGRPVAATAAGGQRRRSPRERIGRTGRPPPGRHSHPGRRFPGCAATECRLQRRRCRRVAPAACHHHPAGDGLRAPSHLAVEPMG